MFGSNYRKISLSEIQRKIKPSLSLVVLHIVPRTNKSKN